MSFVKGAFKIFLIIVAIIAIFIGGFALYIRHQGKNILQKAVGDMLNAEVKFDSISLSFNDHAVRFKGLKIMSKIDFDQNILNAKRFTVILDEEKFEKDKQIVLDQIIIEEATLNIERDKAGVFKLPYDLEQKSHFDIGCAYAQEPQASGLYQFVQYVRKFTVKDSKIIFKDYCIAESPLLSPVIILIWILLLAKTQRPPTAQSRQNALSDLISPMASMKPESSP